MRTGEVGRDGAASESGGRNARPDRKVHVLSLPVATFLLDCGFSLEHNAFSRFSIGFGHPAAGIRCLIRKAPFPGPAAYEGSAMIVQDRGDQLIIIRQTDHAVLSGHLARAFGNKLFSRPEPFESFCLAAAEHDNGWLEWELLPQIDARTFAPYNFMSIPTEEHITLYQRGIERVVRADRYAGLLVSLHSASLYDRTRATMPGFSAKHVRSSESQLVTDFLQRLRLQQLRLKVDLRADPLLKAYADDSVIQANLQRLEALDRLSLYFCLAPLNGATIDAVPTGASGAEADWDLQPAENNFVNLNPYPFAKDPLPVSILARRVPKRPYADEAEFHKILAHAPYFAMNFTLSADSARIQSRSAVA